ncbi:hypothetical protein [Streptomyces antimicrobicus]|uniref:Integral membrane protein n=1 Tax=Streptomyces antimicrobicus TaxID=2883108 RepID=A0ABS8BE57_9ACTN|nr:hypothetical protein [Streptomyces antimicrobicus]MCB5182872.1 hypothetical protein [Streptomyces antimicrobicus]
MSAGTTAARRSKKQARLAAAPLPTQPKKRGKAKKAKAPKKIKLGAATLAALRGQTTPAALVADVEAATVAAVANPRLRWAAYNGSAALAGHALLFPATGTWRGFEPGMGAVMLALPNCGAFVVTIGASYIAYRVAKPFRGLLGPFAPVAPVAAGIGAAFWGQGTAEPIADFLAWSAPWSVLLAPLIVAGGAGALVWTLLESRAAGWRRPLRWLARIPLATVVTSALLYAPGALL